mmetsp:Transcript_8961/g.13378  ORF Transcript_8961/g.13378 Transcript_8961/m.13378 type:complete len:134 (+) Transcript_8961:618-1019(+)
MKDVLGLCISKTLFIDVYYLSSSRQLIHQNTSTHRGTEWNIVHQSSPVMNNLDPEWDEENIDLSILCRGELEEVLRFSVMDYESSGDHVLMGQVEMSVNDFINAFKEDKPFDLEKKGKDTSRGTIVVGLAAIE